MNKDETARILEKLKASDEEVLSDLYKRYIDPVSSYILRHGGTRDEAIDVYQDAWLVLLENIKNNKFKGAATIETYLFSISKNLWLKEVRRKKANKSSTSHFRFFYNVSEDKIPNYSDVISIVQKVINQMEGSCKSFVKAYYVEGLSLKELAIRFGLTEGSAKVKKSRCLRKIKQMVDTELKKTL